MPSASTHPEGKPCRFLRTPRIPHLVLAVALLGLALPAGAQDWVEFIDVTATRLVMFPPLEMDDGLEKDIEIGDLDNDGDTDVIVVQKVPFSVEGGKPNLLFMNEDGVMTDRTSLYAPDMLDMTDDRDLVIVDLDGDGWLDVVTATTFFEQPRVYMNQGETMAGQWLGLDYNAGEARLPIFAPAPKFCAIAAGDVTGDGRPELYFADYENDLEDRLLVNNGSGFFTDQTTTRLTTAMAESVFGTDAAIVDIDNDNDNDIIKNNSSGSAPPPGSSPPAVRVFYNDGSGTFDFLQIAYQEAPYMIDVADFDQNGRQDIFIVDDGQDTVLFNTGNDPEGRAIFTERSVTGSPGTSFFGGNTRVADLDADGVLDILVADVDTDIEGCDRRLTVLRGTGTPPDISYTDPLGGSTRTWTTQGTYDVAVLDINGDGVLDIWAGLCTGHMLLQGVGRLFTDGFESGTTGDWAEP
ncbi:MAG: VCBS repeat-containing protein [Holophagales bacterium]|nr:VCBS repeat-containing protein [Holophagales bacterium]